MSPRSALVGLVLLVQAFATLAQSPAVGSPAAGAPAAGVPARTNPSEAEVRRWAEVYFDRYAARDDWQGFLEQFAEDVAFEDPIARVALNSRDLFREFYFWPDSSFSKHPDHPQTLVLEELIVDGKRSIGRGYFTPFLYLGFTFAEAEPMQFTIWLDWNAEGKITRQVDWIAYPPELMQSMYCQDQAVAD